MAEHRTASRDWTDVIAGAALLAFGLWFVWHAQAEYDLGSLRRMGPGFFPTVLGWLVAAFGALLCCPRCSAAGATCAGDPAAVTIIAGGLAFAWTIEPLGLVPATVALVCIVAFAETRVRLLRTAILALCWPPRRWLSSPRDSAFPFPPSAGGAEMEDTTLGHAGLSASRQAFSPENLLYCFIGVFLGTFIGVLPGIGALATISMLLPLTFHVPATTAIIMLAGIYYGASYGGSTASILLNLPGTPSAAVACLDGYPMSKQGPRGDRAVHDDDRELRRREPRHRDPDALRAEAVGSRAGLRAGGLLRDDAARLVAAATLAQGSPVKGIIMVLFGLCLGMVGTDVQTGHAALHLRHPLPGRRHRPGGAGDGPVRRGGGDQEHRQGRQLRHDEPEDHASLHGADARRHAAGLEADAARHRRRRLLRRAARRGRHHRVLHVLCGGEADREGSLALRQGRDRGRLGAGIGQQRAAQTAFIPTLTLGIPGDAVMALMLGALIIQGIQPGPRLMTEHPEIFWGLIASFWIGNILLVILNIPLIGLWVRMLRIPYSILYPPSCCSSASACSASTTATSTCCW
jgi:hypothetical protein